MSNPPLPLSWRALLDSRAVIERKQGELDNLERNALAKTYTPHMLLGEAFDCVMAMAVLLGPGVVQPALAALASEGGEGGVKGLQVMVALAKPSQALLMIDVLTAANACAACGGEIFAPTVDQAERLLKVAAPDVERLPDARRFRAALAAVAFGQDDLAATFAYGEPIQGRFEPGQMFGPNVQALVHYLTKAVESGASGEDVDPAIRDLLSTFPHKLQDHQLGWGDLGWLGRIRFHQLDGTPLGEVADRMFDYVRTL